MIEKIILAKPGLTQNFKYTEHYPKIFSFRQAKALSMVCKNLDKLTSQFHPSFIEDKIVNKITDLDSLVLKLAENSEKVLKLQQDKYLER